MNAIAKREVMQLTAQNVKDIMLFCAQDADSDIVHGVVCKTKFNTKRIEARTEDIFDMLMQLPEQFMRTAGGGWSFVNMCVDRNGRQWCDFQQTMDWLVMLGIAIGAVEFVFKQRELWQMFPGGMPYIVVNDNLNEQQAQYQGLLKTQYIEPQKADEVERCCGSCKHFKHEDLDGYGYCDALRNREQHCSQKCIKWESDTTQTSDK